MVERTERMTPARGDTKPCSVADCTGMMQFGRRLDNDAWRGSLVPRPIQATTPEEAETRGWVCSADREHFREQ
jgi:hypothetical protein